MLHYRNYMPKKTKRHKRHADNSHKRVSHATINAHVVSTERSTTTDDDAHDLTVFRFSKTSRPHTPPSTTAHAFIDSTELVAIKRDLIKTVILASIGVGI